MSVVSPVVVAYGGTTVILAVWLRGESLLPVQAVGAVLATVGVVLAGWCSTEARCAAPGSSGPAS